MRIAPICLLLFVLSTASATAQPCAITITSTTNTCIQVHPFNVDDFAAVRATPNTRTIELNDAVPWIAEAGIPPPLDVKPAGTGASLRTSTSQWRNFETQMLSRRIDEAKAANKALAQPKAPAVLPSPFELWTTVDLTGLAENADSAVKTSVGANYKLGKTTTVGVEAARAGTQDDKVAGFVSLQATSIVSIDARTQWETATTGAAKTDTNAVSIAPKLKVPMKFDGGQTLEPFVTVKEEFSRAASADLSGQTRNTVSAGTGVTFANPGRYTMSLTADAENLGAPDPTTYKSRFQLSVPLK